MKESKTVVYDGIKFYQTQKGYYLSGKGSEATVRLHVYVWEKYNGKVLKGYHVHHKDLDKDNNEIDNFKLLEGHEHLSLHGNLQDKKMLAERLAKYARPKASEWHRSTEGIEWHKKHYEDTKDKLYQEIEIVCLHCGKKVKVINNGHNKYCSDKCKSSHRIRKKSDFEDRTCVICGNTFNTNKYGKVKNCSKECAIISTNLKKKANRESKENNKSA